jgi:hypothetical protein
MKMLAKLEPISIAVASDVPRIEFPAPAKALSPPIIAFEGVSAGYTPDTPVLRNLTLRIDPDDRIALLGANGNGKSTLAKLLAQRLAPLEGKVTRADKLRIGYFAQHQLDELNETRSPYQHIRELMPDAPEAKVRARAGAIGFSGAAADKLVGNLSGGEKARLLIGLATLHAPIWSFSTSQPTTSILTPAPRLSRRSIAIPAQRSWSRTIGICLRPVPIGYGSSLQAKSRHSKATLRTIAGWFWRARMGRNQKKPRSRRRRAPDAQSIDATPHVSGRSLHR